MTAKFMSATPKYEAINKALTAAHTALMGGMQVHMCGCMVPAKVHTMWDGYKRRHEFARDLPAKCTACGASVRKRLERCRPGFLDWPECACLAHCRCATHVSFVTSGMRARFHVFAAQLALAEGEVQNQVCNMVRGCRWRLWLSVSVAHCVCVVGTGVGVGVWACRVSATSIGETCSGSCWATKSGSSPPCA